MRPVFEKSNSYNVFIFKTLTTPLFSKDNSRSNLKQSLRHS